MSEGNIGKSAFLNRVEKLTFRTQKKVSQKDLLIMRLKEICKNINYGCDFQNGKCKQAKENPGDSKLLSNGQCCCSNCKISLGYLRTVYIPFLEEYEKAWSEETGFYSPKIGCKLSRRLRSATCLGFRCNDQVTILESALLSIITSEEE